MPSLPWLNELPDTIEYQSDHRPVIIDRGWLDTTMAAAEASSVLAPISGGYDPLHLSHHALGPISHSRVGPSDPRVGATIHRSSKADRTATLTLESMHGWYRALAQHGAELPDLGNGPGTSTSSCGPSGGSERIAALGALGCGSPAPTDGTSEAPDVRFKDRGARGPSPLENIDE